MSKRKILDEARFFNLKYLVDNGIMLNDSNFDSSENNIKWLNYVKLSIGNLDDVFKSILVPILDDAYAYRHNEDLRKDYKIGRAHV